MLTFSPFLLDGCRLLCTNTYSVVTCSLYTCTAFLWPYLGVFMYISASSCALRTPSEFSSVPILVADELAHSLSCETPILGKYPIPNPLSPERLSYSHDLVIRVTTTCNISRMHLKLPWRSLTNTMREHPHQMHILYAWVYNIII